MNRHTMARAPALPPRHARAQRRGTQVVLGSRLLLLFAALTICLMLPSTEPLLVLACMFVLMVSAKLLWRVGEPPILFGAFFLQWSQVSLLVIQAAVLGIPLTDVNATYVPGIVAATWLSLAGLLVLAIGMWLMLRRVSISQPFAEFKAEIWRYSPRRAFMAYLAAQLGIIGIDRVTGIFPGLTQALLSLSNFKWAFFSPWVSL